MRRARKAAIWLSSWRSSVSARSSVSRVGGACRDEVRKALHVALGKIALGQHLRKLGLGGGIIELGEDLALLHELPLTAAMLDNPGAQQRQHLRPCDGFNRTGGVNHLGHIAALGGCDRHDWPAQPERGAVTEASQNQQACEQLLPCHRHHSASCVPSL